MQHAALREPRRVNSREIELDVGEEFESAILLLDTEYQDVAYVRSGRIPMRKVMNWEI